MNLLLHPRSGRSLSALLFGFLVCAIAAVPSQAQTDCTTQTDLPETECDVLVEIYSTMGGPGWDFRVWNHDQLPCSWGGVSCAGGRVTGLSWNENGISGTFPASIGNLTALESFSFRWDEAAFPPEFFTLPNVRFLSAHFAGATILDARVVNFTQLESFVMVDVAVARQPFPVFFSQLSSLRHLHLESAALNGPLPVALSDLTDLRTLILKNTELTGPLPSEWVFMTGLEEVDLSHNEITGPLPNGWGTLPNLRILNLEHNGIYSFVRPLWDGLDTLEVLDLSHNSITGPIPASWGSFPALATLDLENNRFTGGVHANLGDDTGPQGRTLLLAMNHLDGEIPAAWADGSLAALSIDNNCLTTTDSDVVELLNSLNPGWFDTQCLPIFTDGFNAGTADAWDRTVGSTP